LGAVEKGWKKKKQNANVFQDVLFRTKQEAGGSRDGVQWAKTAGGRETVGSPARREPSRTGGCPNVGPHQKRNEGMKRPAVQHQKNRALQEEQFRGEDRYVDQGGPGKKKSFRVPGGAKIFFGPG